MLPLNTLSGSRIQRYKNKVGKMIGGNLYVHKQYATEVIPADLLVMYVRHLTTNFEYNTLVYNRCEATMRFDSALDFDTAREPSPGTFQLIGPLGFIRIGHSSSIWHHKWMWVEDDYEGFDVTASYNWSRKWLAKLTEPASGSPNVWKRQLAEHGVTGGYKRNIRKRRSLASANYLTR